MVGNKKNPNRTIISSIDLTGDDDKAENLDFIYLKGKQVYLKKGFIFGRGTGIFSRKWLKF